MRRGTVLDGRYELQEPLGRGGMGQVWSANDRRRQRDVAVKLVTALPRMGEDETFLRFRREIHSVAGLPGRHTVIAHDWGYADLDGERALYMVMERLSGRTLGEAVHQRRPDWRTAADWARQVAAALDAAHRRRIVHRDIKPDNVMFTDDGELKVLDFGIAKFLGDTLQVGGLTGTGVAIGTLLYMSPEQARGERDVDHRTDLYSLGCLLYFTLTGRAPFTADNLLGLVHQKMNGEVVPPHHLDPGVPGDLGELVMRLLARDPAARPATAAETLSLLAPFTGAPAVPAAPAPDVPDAAALRAAATAEIAALRQEAEQDIAKIRVVALKHAETSRAEAEKIWEETRDRAAQAAKEFETTLARRREQAERDLTERQAKAEKRLAEIEHRAEQLRLEAEKLRGDAERRARKTVADAQLLAEEIEAAARARSTGGLTDLARVRAEIDAILADSRYQPVDVLGEQRVRILGQLTALGNALSAAGPADPVAPGRPGLPDRPEIPSQQ
ncbi:protein kinase [Streptomyces sp. NPDC090025]|uniref:serine/threonine-protein kinase n=1 Tax=Streptomyces sp. NPDC090025 TaxID=3365922 RepID=UPI003837116C